MRKMPNLFQGTNILTIISTLVGILVLYIAFINKWTPSIVEKTARFSCELMSYPNEGEVWTVMYRNDAKKSPWLKIVTTMGDNWTPTERCQEVARRLEIYRQDGLTQLTYRPDPSTPNQPVICAKTKISGDNCPLLITLKPNANAYSSLKYMTETLTAGRNINKASDETSIASFSHSASKPLVVDLEEHLADEDRKAGDATK